jgi:hypothetical protein
MLLVGFAPAPSVSPRFETGANLIAHGIVVNNCAAVV